MIREPRPRSLVAVFARFDVSPIRSGTGRGSPRFDHAGTSDGNRRSFSARTCSRHSLIADAARGEIFTADATSHLPGA